MISKRDILPLSFGIPALLWCRSFYFLHPVKRFSSVPPVSPALLSPAMTHKRYLQGGHHMETRIALIGIILETRESVDELNHLLSEYGDYVIGRMGIPYREKGIHVISVAMDAPNNIISALSGKLGMLPGVSTKTIYGKNI